MSAVTVYEAGPICASACAPESMNGTEVAAEVNRIHPAGTESGWSVSKDPRFSGGQTNPCACHKDSGRRHWLLKC